MVDGRMKGNGIEMLKMVEGRRRKLDDELTCTLLQKD
jgi:hypothetical protein